MPNGHENDNDYRWLLTRKKTAYQFLELEHDEQPNRSKIRRAYLKKALELHPDKNKSRSARLEFREVAVSYHVLSDPDLRIKYDEYLNNQIVNKRQLSHEKQLRDVRNSTLKDELLRNELYHRDETYRNNFRMRKLELLHRNFDKVKRVRQMKPNVTGNKDEHTPEESDSVFRFPYIINVKWKNRKGASKLIDENVIQNLMGIFGEVTNVRISSLNSANNRYHYAEVEYKRSISGVLASCFAYSKPYSLWDEMGMTRISRLIRSIKMNGYNKQNFELYDNMTFDEYLSISTLKIKKAISSE